MVRKSAVLGRFAPSPSGYMHMGNLLSSLLAWLDARSLGGGMLLRMEDLDPARSRTDFAEAIADDLRWLGLDWDIGYPDPAYCQSRRTAVYEEAFHALDAEGIIYPCWCSRAERLAAGAPHPGEENIDSGCRCARLTGAERAELFRQRAPAWKVRAPNLTITIDDGHYGELSQNLAADCGDFILRRADGVFAYQLAVSVDDALMGVTRVVRGRDLLESAPRQAWLIGRFGHTPPAYAHAPLLVGESHKLSKRLGDLNTQTLRRNCTPEELLGKLAYLSGLIPKEEPVKAAELVPEFSWDKVRKEDIHII